MIEGRRKSAVTPEGEGERKAAAPLTEEENNYTGLGVREAPLRERQPHHSRE